MLLALGGLSLIGFVVESVAWWIWVADAVLLLGVLYDMVRVPNPSKLDVRRSIPDCTGLSVKFTRTVRIDVSSLPRAGGLRVELFEEFSPAFVPHERTVLDPADRNVIPVPDGPTGRVFPMEQDPTGGADRAVLPSAGPLDLERVYSCTVRGVYTVGDMRIRLSGPLGLMQRQKRLFGEQRIRIEPALLGLKNTLRLAASERWHDLGVRFLRRRGGVTEFESMRDYVIGDDRRSLDWKAFAKRGRPIVRQYQEERGQELILLVDCGRRMGATTARGDMRGWTKLDHALDSALQLAAVALNRGDRVGMATFDAKLDVWVPPTRGKAQFGRLRDAVFDTQPREADSSLGRALQQVAVHHRRRATVLVVSDVADLLSAGRQRKALATAISRHKVIFAGLDDPAVRALATGELEGDPAERAVALHQMEEREKGLAELGRSGARVLGALPAESAAPMLAAWLEARRTG